MKCVDLLPKKYVFEQDIIIPKWSKTLQTFWSHSSVFTLEKQPKKLHFQSFFTSNIPFGGYLQWNAWSYFEEICSWTRYSNANLIKNISNFLVALLRFCYRKSIWKTKFSEFFTSKRLFGGYIQWNARSYFQKRCSWTMYRNAKLIKNISNFLVALFRFCIRKTT